MRLERFNELMNMAKETIEQAQHAKCKYCQGVNTVRFGKYQGVQRWWCKACKRKFIDSDTLPHGQREIKDITTALSAYFGGMSFRQVATHLKESSGVYADESTIYEWVRRFGRKSEAVIKDDKPNVGDVWVADETVLRIDGKNVWFWDVMDANTRYLLASHITNTRTKRSVEAVMLEAAKRAGRNPRHVITDRLNVYPDGIDAAFGSGTSHIQSGGLDGETNNNLIERFHGTLKARTKVLRGLKSIETAKDFTDAWLVYYNYLRGHESLKGKTPAEVAGLKPKFHSFNDVTRLPETQTQYAPTAEPLPLGRVHVRITPPRPRIGR